MKIPVAPDGKCRAVVAANIFRYKDFYTFREVTVLVKIDSLYHYGETCTYQIIPDSLPFNDETAMKCIERQRALMDCSLTPKAVERRCGARNYRPRPFIGQNDVRPVIGDALTRHGVLPDQSRVGYIGGGELAIILKELGYVDLIDLDNKLAAQFDRDIDDYDDDDSDVGFWPRSVCPYHRQRDEDMAEKSLADGDVTKMPVYSRWVNDRHWRYVLYRKGCDFPLCTRALAETASAWLGLVPNDFTFSPWEGLLETIL
jgi:hypothetical protein